MATRSAVSRSGVGASRSWREDAACHHVDPELFFPVERGHGAAYELELARSVCARCPVRSECMLAALELRVTDGIWGGLTVAELRRVVALPRRQAS